MFNLSMWGKSFQQIRLTNLTQDIYQIQLINKLTKKYLPIKQRLLFNYFVLRFDLSLNLIISNKQKQIQFEIISNLKILQTKRD